MNSVVTESQQCSERSDSILDSLKQVSDLLGEWGFQSCQQVFWDNEITMHCLQNLNDNELSDLCKLSKATIGLKISLRNRIERFFNRLPAIENRPPIELDKQQQQRNDKASSCSSSHISIREILKNGPKGALLLGLNKLTEASRGLVVEIIANFLLDNKIEPNKVIWPNIASQIIQIFPKETANVYYKPACTFDGKYHKASGKLVDRYNNEKFSRKKLVGSELAPNPNEEPNASLSPPSPSTGSTAEEQSNSMKWLQTSRTPVELVKSHWRKSFNIRQQFLQEKRKTRDILLAWPILGTPMCQALINIDFEIKYGQKTQLFEMWPNFIEKFLLQLKDIKDINSKKFAKNLKTNLTVDGRDIVVCYLLPSLILPTFKKNLAKKNEKKDIWKPCILESQQAFIVHAQNSINMEILIKNRKTFVQDKGLQFQPMLIVLGGEEIFEGRYFYTWYDGIVQKFNKFIEALDFTFKLTRTLNLEYSEDCMQIWYFFAKHIYKTTTSDDMRIASVDNFINSLSD